MSTKPDSATGKPKKGVSLKVVLIGLAVVLIVAGLLGAKKFLLKPKPAETTTSTMTSPSGPAVVNAEAGAPATAAASTTASSKDGGSKSGTIVRAGMRACGVNRSHVFIVALPEGEKELVLAGVDSFHFGPVTRRADDAANTLMAGKRIKVAVASEDFFEITGTATLADGRDMAETLAAAGLVQSSDGATDAVKKACDKAQDGKRGLYGMI
ncbi:MAG: hypothetical protein NT039_03060 [Candidatus Berkelbacteria bacterium]|nr:hypothetical protein [Candidatus Berkelbacteria bacterium]